MCMSTDEKASRNVNGLIETSISTVLPTMQLAVLYEVVYGFLQVILECETHEDYKAVSVGNVIAMKLVVYTGKPAK